MLYPLRGYSTMSCNAQMLSSYNGLRQKCTNKYLKFNVKCIHSNLTSFKNEMGWIGKLLRSQELILVGETVFDSRRKITFFFLGPPRTAGGSFQPSWDPK